MTPKILIVYPNLPLMMSPAISVGIFNALCKREGCEVKLFETTEYSDEYSNRHIRMTEIGASRQNKDEEVKDMFRIKPTSDIIPDFIDLVTKYTPDLILMSVQEDVWDMAKKLLESISHLNIPNVLGGIFPTSAHHIVLNDPNVSYVAQHEGENIVLDLINAIKSKKSFKSINGICWKDKFGLIQKTPPPKLCNISDITPDFTCFENKRWQRPMGGRMFKRAISMETYRGCPYNCTFCNSPGTREFSKEINGNYLRRKCSATIERDFLYYKKHHNPDLVMFQDDSFLARPKKEILEFCDLWGKHKTPFWFNTRIEDCKPDLLEAVKMAGAYRMTFGIESGDELYRKEMLSRPISNEKYIEHFKYINDSNIPYSLNVIIGMPFETREMVLETARLVNKSKGYDGITVSIFQPYHGTNLRKVAVENGFLDESFINKGGYLDEWHLTMPEPYLQKDDVYRLVKTFALYAYYPESMWDIIYKSETDDELYRDLIDKYNKEFFKTGQLGGVDRISNYCLKHDATSTYNFD